MHHGLYLSFLRTNQLSQIHCLIAMISKMQGDVVNFVIEICVKLSSIKRRLEEQYSTNKVIMLKTGVALYSTHPRTV